MKPVSFIYESVSSKLLREPIAYSKAQGGKLNYGAAGIGHPFTLAMGMLKQPTGLDNLFVHYKGHNAVGGIALAERNHHALEPGSLKDRHNAGCLQGLCATQPRAGHWNSEELAQGIRNDLAALGPIVRSLGISLN